MRTLECPRCREPMIVAEYRGIEIDSCGSCRGVWLDGGELEALVGSGVPGLEKPAGGLGPPELDCPICVDKLAKARHGPTGVVLDRCPHGDGIWFDPGELEQILAAHPETGAAEAGHDAHAAKALSAFFGDRPALDNPDSGKQKE